METTTTPTITDGFYIEMCVNPCVRMTESIEIEETTLTITSIFNTQYTICHTGNGLTIAML